MVIHPTDMRRCAACSARVSTPDNLCLFLMGDEAALCYALCGRCSASLRRGERLAPRTLAQIEQVMEPKAQALGLSPGH